MNKKIVVYDYAEGWMIYLYDGLDEIKYWNCNEHGWDSVWDYLNLLKTYEEVEIIKPKMKTFDDYIELKNKFDKDWSERNFDILRNYKCE